MVDMLPCSSFREQGGTSGLAGAVWVRSGSKAELHHRAQMKTWDKTEPQGLSPGASAAADVMCYTEIWEDKVKQN